MTQTEEATGSLERTLALLSAFRGDNRPQRPIDLARALNIPRSSAYQIIRTLLAHDYLEQVARGQVRLGPKFSELLIAYQMQHRTLPVDPAWRARKTRANADPLAQVPRSFLWNPQLTEMVDCTRWRRSAPFRIGFANASTSNPWRVAMLHGILQYASERSSRISEMVVRDASDDIEKQASDIAHLITREKVDLLLVSCNPAEPVDQALALARELRVPVVAVDRRPTKDEHFLTYVSASDIAIGRITAQWMVEKIEGQGTIFMLAGIEGASPAQRRVAAATEVFSQHPALKIAPVAYTDWQEDRGQAIARQLIEENGIPAGVWCDSGLQGAGSMQAFLELGVEESDVPPHTGGDVNHVFQIAAQHGISMAAVEYPAWMGARALQAGLDVLAGKTMPRHIEVHSQVVVSRGRATPSVHPDVFVDDYVRWDRPADFVASHGLGDNYSPERFALERVLSAGAGAL